MEKSVSSAYGTGVDSYLFDSIFKPGGRLTDPAASLMAIDRNRACSREIAAFSWAIFKQMKYCRRSAGWTTFMANGICFATAFRLVTMREDGNPATQATCQLKLSFAIYLIAARR